MIFKKGAEIITSVLEEPFSETREDIGFSPVGLDEPYRVFTAKDPIGFKGRDTNLFGYTLNNPLNLTDISGFCPNKKSENVGGPKSNPQQAEMDNPLPKLPTFSEAFTNSNN